MTYIHCVTIKTWQLGQAVFVISMG